MASRDRFSKAPKGSFLTTSKLFVQFCAQRFLSDRCNQKAAALTFTSLLAIVPLLSVSFAIFSAFPAFSRLKGKLNDFIFDNFVPQVGEEVRQYLDQFTSQTGSLTAIGVVVLAFSAILLLNTITATFNDIWKADTRRGLVSRLLLYWALLTLPPLLFGASLSISSYLFTIVQISGVEQVTGSMTQYAVIIPFILQVAGFTFLFMILPHAQVKARDAILGGLTASIMLEFLKRAFAWYLTTFPTYQTIYGALATVPIFLIWVYVSWNIVLLGAVITAVLPEFRSGSRHHATRHAKGYHRMDLMLRVLFWLGKAQSKGHALSIGALLDHIHMPESYLKDVLYAMEAENLVARSMERHWMLARSLDQITLGEIHDLALNLNSVGLQNLMSHSAIETMRNRNETIMETDLRMAFATMEETGDSEIETDPPSEDEDPRFYKKVVSLIGLGAAASHQ